jgi:hypothetical protein
VVRLRGFATQLELDHVVSLHLNSGLLGSEHVSTDVAQLIGLLRTATALPNCSADPAGSFSWWLHKQPAGSKTGLVAELASGGHMFAALKARMPAVHKPLGLCVWSVSAMAA